MKTQINISSMRAALNSAYCMRAILETRKRQMAVSDSCAGAFHYQEGQHAVNGNGNGNGKTGQEKTVVPPEVKVIPTPAGKRWSTPTMEVELRGDILEIRDGFGNIIDAVVLDKFPAKKPAKISKKIPIGFLKPSPPEANLPREGKPEGANRP